MATSTASYHDTEGRTAKSEQNTRLRLDVHVLAAGLNEAPIIHKYGTGHHIPARRYWGPHAGAGSSAAVAACA